MHFDPHSLSKPLTDGKDSKGSSSIGSTGSKIFQPPTRPNSPKATEGLDFVANQALEISKVLSSEIGVKDFVAQSVQTSSPKTPSSLQVSELLQKSIAEKNVENISKIARRELGTAEDHLMAPIALGLIGSEESLQSLENLSRSKDAFTRQMGAIGLCYLVGKGNHRALRLLIPFMQEANKETLTAMADALGNSKGLAAIPALQLLLESPYVEVRLAVTTALGQIGGEKAEELLEELAESPEKVDEGIATFNRILKDQYGIEDAYNNPSKIDNIPEPPPGVTEVITGNLTSDAKLSTKEQLAGLKDAKESAELIKKAAIDELIKLGASKK